MRYDLTLFDLIVDKIEKPISYYVDFLEDRLVYHIEAILNKAPIPEEEIYESEENIYLHETATYKREVLKGASYTYKYIPASSTTDEIDLYTVILEMAGYENGIEISFNNKKAADKFHKQVIQYIFEK